MNMKNRVCICIAGWHFSQEMFSSLRSVNNVDIFIVSHKPESQIPEYVFSLVSVERVFIEPNYGYDWGCYQQFLDKGLWKKYSHIVFMHDDIVIKKTDFIEAGLQLLDQGYNVIGNGRPSYPKDWYVSHPESFIHSSWKPTRQPFLYNVVRGSFFITTKKSLEKLKSFEVFWDRFRATPYFGNWSLRASCGKWQDCCGQQCFGYLSNSPLVSEWISEMVRGEDTNLIIDNRGWIDRGKSHLVYVLSRQYMTKKIQGKQMTGIISRAISKFLKCASVK